MVSSAASDLRTLLSEVRTIAIVGLSANPARPSNEVAAFLTGRCYHCIGVNPGLAGRRIHGIPIVAHLGDIGQPIDMVDIFRASPAIGGVVEDALSLDPRPLVIWMQLGVLDVAAAERAEAAGLTVVMDNCPKIVLTMR